MVSLIAIVHAKRVWCGGPLLDDTVPQSLPPTGVLVEDGVITFIGSSEEVLQRYAVREPLVLQNAPKHPTAVEGGRRRTPFARIIDCKQKYCVYPGFIDSHVHMLDGGRQLFSLDLSHATNREQFTDTLRRFADSRCDIAEGEWIYGGGWSEALLGERPTREWLDAVHDRIPMVLFSKDVHSVVMNTAALRHCHVVPGSDDGEPLLSDIEGGCIVRDVALEPTGLLCDNAIVATKKYWPPRDTARNQRAALDAATSYLLERGFTTVFSMMSLRFDDNIHEIQFLREMEQAGVTRLRVRYGMPFKDVPELLDRFYGPVAQQSASGTRRDAFTLPHRFTCLSPSSGGGYLMLGAVKLFSDGSLSSRTAAMNRPYGYNVLTDGDVDSDRDVSTDSDMRSDCRCGFLTMPREDMRHAIATVLDNHLQCVVHAIGDRAVAAVNKVFSETLDSAQRSGTAGRNEHASCNSFTRDPRSRVEHCQHVANVAKEVKRMSEHGVIASMQPCHLLFDGDYITAAVGSNRKNKAYLWRTFARGGIHVAFGSDWPVAPADLLDGLRGAVTRVPDVIADSTTEYKTRLPASSPSAGRSGPVGKRYHETWNAAECFTIEQALRAYTYEGAYGAFLEEFTGTLREGMWADITIVSDDLQDVSSMAKHGDGPAVWWPPGKEPFVLYTIVGGMVEYER